MQYRRNDPRRAVGRRRDHAPARCILLIDGQGIEIDPLHGTQGGADHIGLVQLLQAAVQLGRPAFHIQSARKNAFMFQTVFNTVLHGAPEREQTGANLFFAAPDFFVLHHQLRHTQVVLLAQFQ
ncbi:hypothetical protein D3C79_800350 [compost metagenome]